MSWKWALRVSTAAALGVLLTPAGAAAWGPTGHMITAQIAYDALTGEARREVDRLIGVLAAMAPERHHAVTSALWADDLKRQGVSAFDSWHYINTPYNPGGVAEVAGPSEHNVVWAIRQTVATLRSATADDLPKAMMLRFLIHLIGDLHQPLHCVNRFTARHPQGDRGGNDFALAGGGKHPHLHVYWDHMADLFPIVDGDSDGWQAIIRDFTDQVTRAVPKESVPRWTVDDPEVWAGEGFEIAVGQVYVGIEEGTAPSAQYAAKARQIARRRLAVGGYRLGALLNSVLGKGGD